MQSLLNLTLAKGLLEKYRNALNFLNQSCWLNTRVFHAVSHVFTSVAHCFHCHC